MVTMVRPRCSGEVAGPFQRCHRPRAPSTTAQCWADDSPVAAPAAGPPPLPCRRPPPPDPDREAHARDRDEHDGAADPSRPLQPGQCGCAPRWRPAAQTAVGAHRVDPSREWLDDQRQTPDWLQPAPLQSDRPSRPPHPSPDHRDGGLPQPGTAGGAGSRPDPANPAPPPVVGGR